VPLLGAFRKTSPLTRTMKLARLFRFLPALFPCVLGSALHGSTITWTNDTANNAWSTAGNWDPATEPNASSEVVFPAGLAGTITTTNTENALSLRFEGDYTLSGGTLALDSGNSIEATAGVTASIQNALTITGGLVKTGPGTLVLQGSNTNAGGTVIQQGKIRAQNAGAMGAAGVPTTVKGGAILEIGPGITLDRPVLLEQGATLAGAGTATNNGVTTVDPAATLVHLATSDAGDVFTTGNGANDLTGGAATTVIQPLGPGAVRLGAASNYAGSWLLDQGRLELASTTALGNDSARSVTLAGGTLSARINTASNFTSSPGNQILITEDSAIWSDRSTASSGLTHTFGNLAMAGQTLTIAPGPNSTSGTAGIAFGNVILSGNPQFHIESGGAIGRLAILTLDGGVPGRTITKTGAGELSITGGTSHLAAGSALLFSGGGLLDLVFPDLGMDAVIPVSAVQNPLGEATLSLTNGTLRLQANGANNSTAQSYQLATPIALAGSVVFDPLRRSNSGSNKTYELTSLSLGDGTELSVSGANTHGIRLTGPLVLQGDVVLGGVNLSNRSGLLTLAGGISGGAGDSVEIRGGTSPLNLTISAASTYGGGTTLTGGNVTLEAANALGSGPVVVTGGTLRANGIDLLADRALTVNGGTLEIRNDTGASFESGSLTVSGNSTLLIGNNGSGTSQVITLPDVDVSGTTTLNLTAANSFTPTISNLHLGGDLTLSHGITARVGTITEDSTPRVLIKAGLGTLELEDAGSHSGGTEVLAGILLVKHPDALGTGTLTLGDTSGTSAATARFNAGLGISNHLFVRDGSTGARTLDSNAGNLTWTGGIELERLLTLNNGSSILSSTLSGAISGIGTLSKTGVGDWILSHPSNNFGGGEADAIAISAGAITVTADGPLGNPGNGITLTSSGLFRADGSFTTHRTFTFSGSGGTTGIQVMADNTLTVSAALAGTGTFNKSGTGILEIGPAVDSSATRDPGAITAISAGTLRVQSAKALGDASALNASGGTIELLADANTDFAHPLTVSGTVSLLVDRASGGSGNNGRHQLGALSLNSGANFSVSGGNGYGLSAPEASLQFSPTLNNQSAAPLLLGGLIANPATGSRTLTVGGSGDIHILGAMSQASGSGGYGITKNGPGTFRFGTSATAFNGALAVRDGTVDLNGLSHSVGLLTLGGAVSDHGAKVVTGPAGNLTLASGLTFSATGPAPDATITGNVTLAPVSHTFFIPSSSAAVAEVTIDGPLTGSPGSELTKTSTGTLRFAGSSHNSPGPVAVNGGTLELAKTGGANAVGSDALTLNGGTVRLLAANQIPDGTPVSIGATNSSTLNLNGFTETLGGATLSQSGTFNSSMLATGTDGTLVLAGDLFLHNNGSSSGNISRNILVTGTGTRSTAANDGTLDLGGANRTIHVNTTTVGTNTVNANATIETRIINGGIIKTGPRTLVLSHPDNSFAGGLLIAEGTVSVTHFGALGSGPVTFAHSGGGSAALDFGTTAGTLGGDLTVSGGGGGAATLVFSAPAPQSLTLTGNITLQSTLTADVVNGSLNDDGGALLDLTGTIDDGTSTAGLVKLGQGILRLAAGNTYSGPTAVRKGVLSIPSDDALGDSDAALTLDGGLLHATASITSTRVLNFGPDGGGLRIDSPGVLEFTGDIEWGTGTTSFHGSGMTILSGNSTGSGGDLWLGRPMDFATPPLFGGPTVANGHVLSLRGNVALPSGNIEFSNGAILSLGSGDFIRPLGEGPVEFQMPTSTTVGWAAHGADRIVNINGDDPIIWGQESPRFLSQSGTNTRGRLALGHTSATHTVDFQSGIELNSAVGGSSRWVEIGDGTATLDARLSGGFTNTPDPTERTRFLSFIGDGNSEISGPLAGRIYVNKYGAGTITLSGDNSAHTGGLFVDEGTMIIAGDTSYGSYDYVEVWEGGVIDASALTGPLSLDPPDQSYLGVDGTLIGDAVSPSYFYGKGFVTGDLLAPAESYFEPGYDQTLHIGGDFTLEEYALLGFFVDGTDGLVPNVDFNRTRVTGTVALTGGLDWFARNLENRLGETIIFLLNDGDDPVQGNFAGLPEGAVIEIGGELALQITYQANGDGGTVANDVAVTVIEGTVGPDVAVDAAGPASIAPGAEFEVTFTVTNPGPGNADGLALVIHLPANADFVNSDPPGDFTPGTGEGGGGGELTIDLDGLPEGSATQITLTFTAPPDPDTVSISASLTSDETDPNPGNNSADIDITVDSPPAVIVLTSFSFDPVAGTGELMLETIDGASYTLQQSNNLIDWNDIGSHIGDGNPLTIPLTLDEAPEFFRVRLNPAVPSS
jgi:autotransporter-associated beta strand protein